MPLRGPLLALDTAAAAAWRLSKAVAGGSGWVEDAVVVLGDMMKVIAER